jgi:hypothetical protein
VPVKETELLKVILPPSVVKAGSSPVTVRGIEMEISPEEVDTLESDILFILEPVIAKEPTGVEPPTGPSVTVWLDPGLKTIDPGPSTPPDKTISAPPGIYDEPVVLMVTVPSPITCKGGVQVNGPYNCMLPSKVT